jgi:carboxypeptidase T
MHDLAVEMAATIPKLSGSGTYTPMQAVDFGYTCQGTMGDWGYAEERIFAYTLELATSFAPAASHVAEICEDNLQAALIMIDRVSKSTVTGNITDESDNPIVAAVHVTEIDEQTGMTEVEPVRSGSTFGRYYRLLLPGTYTFTFSYPGYADVIAENVPVTLDGVTELDIQFTEIVPIDESVNITMYRDTIRLNWIPDETASYYEIHSSLSPDGPFEMDAFGEVTTAGTWIELISEPQKYYRVVKFTEE